MPKGEIYAILSALAWAFGVIAFTRLGAKLSPLSLNLRKNLLVLAMLLPLLALPLHSPARLIDGSSAAPTWRWRWPRA